MRRPRGCWLSASCSCTPPPPPHRCFFWQSNSFLKKAPRVLERSSGSQRHYSNRRSPRPLGSPALSATYLAVSVCRVTRGLLRRWLSFWTWCRVSGGAGLRGRRERLGTLSGVALTTTCTSLSRHQTRAGCSSPHSHCSSTKRRVFSKFLPTFGSTTCMLSTFLLGNSSKACFAWGNLHCL